MTWILILTLVAYSEPAITHVGPFATKAECLIAGNAWIKQNSGDNHWNRSVQALCVQSTAKATQP